MDYYMTKPDEAEIERIMAEAEKARVTLPCMECGANTPEEAEKLCNCGGDKDHCHGCDLWPVIRPHAMSWNDYLIMILNHYSDKPDDCALSLGDWTEPRPTMVPGVELPEFRAFIRLELGELRKLEAAL